MRSGNTVNLYQNEPVTSAPTQSLNVADLGPVNIAGGGGSDVVIVDYSGGDPIPTGLSFEAASGGLASPQIVIKNVTTGTGSAPQYTLSTSGLTVVNASVSDSISLTNVVSYDLFNSDSAGSLTIASGSPVFIQDLGSNGASVNVTVDAGALLGFGSTQHLNDLAIQSGASVAMLPAGQRVLMTNNLTVGGVLDLASNDLIVNTPASSVTLDSAVIAFDTALQFNTLPTGQGVIESTTAATDGLTLGFAPESVASLSSLDGQPVSASANPSAYIVRYTTYGDLDLSGTTNVVDLNTLNSHYNRHVPAGVSPWSYGDIYFDSNHIVNIQDYNKLTANFNKGWGAEPVDTPLDSAYTLSLPAQTPDNVNNTRWDINWGDGTNDSYTTGAGTIDVSTASHIYTAVGLAGVQMTAVTYDPSTGYSSYLAPAEAVNVYDPGIKAVPLPLSGSSSDVIAITCDTSGDTIVTVNGNLAIDKLTSSILSLSITGNVADISVDFTNGDPLPLSGLSSDARIIELDGPHGSDPLVTTTTAAYIGSDVIRHLAATQITDNLTTSNGVLAIAGTSVLSDPSADSVTASTGATVLFNGSQTLSALTINAGATVREGSANTTFGAEVLTLGSLTINNPDTAGDGGGVLDLGNGDLIIAPNSVPAASGTTGQASPIAALLTAGYDNGFWDGINPSGGPNPAAIISSGSANDPTQTQTLGYTSVGGGSGQFNGAFFDGEPVTIGNTLVGIALPSIFPSIGVLLAPAGPPATTQINSPAAVSSTGGSATVEVTGTGTANGVTLTDVQWSTGLPGARFRHEKIGGGVPLPSLAVGPNLTPAADPANSGAMNIVINVPAGTPAGTYILTGTMNGTGGTAEFTITVK